MRRRPNRARSRSSVAHATAARDSERRAHRHSGTPLSGVTDDAVRQFDATPDERPGHREAATWGSPPVVEPGD